MAPRSVHPLPPGSTIGIMGGGQLGRMTALAAARLGYRCHIFTPEADSPGIQVSAAATIADYDDRAALKSFAEAVNVVTFEFENVPVEAVHAIDGLVPVRPSGAALHIAQQRGREKTFLAEQGIPTVPFARASSRAELVDAVARIGTPVVVKSAAYGYDGKGQQKVVRAAEAERAWQALATDEVLVEKFVALQAEISVIAARGLDGAVVEYPPFENRHSQHILDVTTAPAAIAAETAARARATARQILEALDYIGLLCVEFFLTTDGELLVNELAPRPHNSGHLTFDAAVTSQFEQQVRAICGLPLGSTELLRPAAMANLLGDLWADGEPNWAAACRFPTVKLHLYGKTQPRPGRKMGHLTATGRTVQEAQDIAVAARDALLG